MWVFEIYMSDLRSWWPFDQGTEEECRERFDWYTENRPDLANAGQLNLRDTEANPEPPHREEHT